MKRFAAFSLVVGLATAGPAALAEQAEDQVVRNQDSKPQPVQMTEAQMDNVAAGALIDIVLIDLVDIDDTLRNNNVQVAVPVNAAVAANVLGGGALAGAAQRPGRQFATQ